MFRDHGALVGVLQLLALVDSFQPNRCSVSEWSGDYVPCRTDSEYEPFTKQGTALMKH